MLAARADTSLRAGSSPVGALLEAEKDVLKLDHPGVGEQQSCIVRRNKRRAIYSGMILPGEITEKRFSDLVAGQSTPFPRTLADISGHWVSLAGVGERLT